MDNVTISPNDQVGPCVEMIQVCGEWFVRVVNGDEEIIRSFELEAFALAYAEGQRIRLGLAYFDQL
ncbi:MULTISPECIES: hypothetical protein [unclassified Mesorhizobium]|uniref:hypothetical protein n=1 Tax=unclassified Mesorhizobium TaxID=325217 RepID=UPI000BAF6F1F|nr:MULTISPECIES: hypothetical protein [unclassified Mesorhizobium]PBB24017.1 hypothetical protein CK232_24985 [Mesorhizobium sp. WSM4304]PBB72821.1 hypothetical protein CK227_24375 [Mesorhizobium sp. WSM4308]